MSVRIFVRDFEVKQTVEQCAELNGAKLELSSEFTNFFPKGFGAYFKNLFEAYEALEEEYANSPFLFYAVVTVYKNGEAAVDVAQYLS